MDQGLYHLYSIKHCELISNSPLNVFSDTGTIWGMKGNFYQKSRKASTSSGFPGENGDQIPALAASLGGSGVPTQHML